MRWLISVAHALAQENLVQGEVGGPSGLNRFLWSRLVGSRGLGGRCQLAKGATRRIEPRLKGAGKLRSAATAFSLLALSLTCGAGPVDFGVAEYNAAVASRNLKWKVKYDVSLEPPETYRIEPYAYGGAHVSGGDLRGLMYGLLDAADQVRSTGHIKQIHSVPAIAIRGLRRFSRDDVPDWRAYFEMLARDRFNRFTLVFTEPPSLDPSSVEKLRSISQLAADYAVDFTLALWYPPNASEIGFEKIIAACPLIRSVQIREPSHDLEAYRTRVFKPIHEAGRRIALDLDPELVTMAQQEGVALRVDPSAWPPNFEIEAPVDYASHEEFYWLWGRLGYSGSHEPKSKPAHGETSEELGAAAQIVSALAIARGGTNEWSANIHPADLARTLGDGAAELESSAVPDLQLLAKIARGEATKQSLANPISKEPMPLARPVFTHTVVHNATPDQTINLTFQIAPIKDVRVVRLHYRALTAVGSAVVEKPAALSLTFAIPPQPADILYYFEVVDRNERSWLEPDPFTATPYHVIRVQVPPPPP